METIYLCSKGNAGVAGVAGVQELQELQNACSRIGSQFLAQVTNPQVVVNAG
jgi:hypothetical protein